MGESQCPTCHHIVTGFERDDFEAGLAVLAAKDAEIKNLLAKLAQIAGVCRDNADAGCNQAMALKFVLSIATQ